MLMLSLQWMSYFLISEMLVVYTIIDLFDRAKWKLIIKIVYIWLS